MPRIMPVPVHLVARLVSDLQGNLDRKLRTAKVQNVDVLRLCFDLIEQTVEEDLIQGTKDNAGTTIHLGGGPTFS